MSYDIENIACPAHKIAPSRTLTEERRAIQQLEIGQSFAFDPKVQRRVENAVQSERRRTQHQFRIIDNRCYRVA
jgi:hypothetical protein